MSKNLKVNDKVLIIAGDNKGKEAKIVAIDRFMGKVYLEGIGQVERHMKKSYLNPAGGKKTVHLGIDVSNVKLVEAAKFTKPAAKKADKKDKKDNKKEKKGAK
ncbi:50S ribosomal protein L24 [Candidatus Saccharibacteria bacterium]|nr:50S ribosomal protein L24 [Candidatus Saccharibacteria bacterium]